MPKIRKNSWDGVLDEIWERLCNALKSLQFIAYFFVGILLLGGLGVWLPYAIDDNSSVVFFESQSVFTYSVAILGTLCVEGFLVGNKQKNLAALGLIFGVIAFLLCSFGYYNQQEGSSLWVNIGAGLSLFIFLMANVNDSRFDDEEDEHKADSTGFPKADASNIKDKNDD
jgi:hypothetical protein